MSLSLECQSCKDDRRKKGLSSIKKVKLPEAITTKGFRHPKIPVWVCPYCDGETLITSALRNLRDGDTHD